MGASIHVSGYWRPLQTPVCWMKAMSGAWHHSIWLQKRGTPKLCSCCCAKELCFTGKLKYMSMTRVQTSKNMTMHWTMLCVVLQWLWILAQSQYTPNPNHLILPLRSVYREWCPDYWWDRRAGWSVWVPNWDFSESHFKLRVMRTLCHINIFWTFSWKQAWNHRDQFADVLVANQLAS